MHTPPIEAHVGGALVLIVAIAVVNAPRRSACAYTPDFTNVTGVDAHFSLNTCVAISFNSYSIFDTDLIAGEEFRLTATWLRADPTCGYWAGSSTPGFTSAWKGKECGRHLPKFC
jgi:hypothetical protein